jgi:hypothetical protein
MGAPPRRPLVVCSLELDALGPMLAALESDFDVHTFPLRRDELRGSGRVPPAFEGGAVLVVHVVDGRALLLDDDGFYNGFLVACAHRALGDVFLALAGCETDAGDLSDGAVVRELSGPQPSVGALAAQRRFLTLGATLNATQVAHLRGRSLPPLDVPPGVRAKAASPPKRGAIGLCPIL